MKRYCLIFVFLQTYLLVNGQNFSFKWTMIPSMDYHSMAFDINRMDNKSIVTLKETHSNDSVSKQIISPDLDSLYNILINLKYRFQDNIYQDTSKRIYFPTKVLNEKWLIVDGDSLRKENIWIKGLEFDSHSNKCYQFTSIACTDGITYVGYFKTDKKDKSYSVHSCFMTSDECRINQLVLNIIRTSKLDVGIYKGNLQSAENCKPFKIND